MSLSFSYPVPYRGTKKLCSDVRAQPALERVPLFTSWPRSLTSLIQLLHAFHQQSASTLFPSQSSTWRNRHACRRNRQYRRSVTWQHMPTLNVRHSTMPNTWTPSCPTLNPRSDLQEPCLAGRLCRMTVSKADRENKQSHCCSAQRASWQCGRAINCCRCSPPN